MNNSLKRYVAFLRATQVMRAEMDRAWKDFFEKNPGEKEEITRRWLEKRLRNARSSKDPYKGSRMTVKNALRSEFR